MFYFNHLKQLVFFYNKKNHITGDPTHVQNRT